MIKIASTIFYFAGVSGSHQEPLFAVGTLVSLLLLLLRYLLCMTYVNKVLLFEELLSVSTKVSKARSMHTSQTQFFSLHSSFFHSADLNSLMYLLAIS